MKSAMLCQLTANFKRETNREPDERESKHLDYLSFLFTRDIKYILKLEIKDMVKENIERDKIKKKSGKDKIEVEPEGEKEN